MSLIITRSRRQPFGELPQAPFEIQEEVELYARESGRTGRMHFIPFGGWFARFELRSNDKRLLIAQEGRSGTVPTEDVWFHIPNPHEGETIDIRSRMDEFKNTPLAPNAFGLMRQGAYLPLDVVQMGAGGVRRFLDRGNTWSGRGEFNSIEDAVHKARENDQVALEKNREKARQQARDRVKDTRRHWLRIPFVGVLTNIGKKGGQ